MSIGLATRSIETFIFNFILYFGWYGNLIFFSCSAWFLVDNKEFKIKKIVPFMLDTVAISVAFLIPYIIIMRDNLSIKILVKSVFPLLFATNWYVIFYIAFIVIHPMINNVLERFSKKQLLFISVIIFTYAFGGRFLSENKPFACFFNGMLIVYVLIFLKKKYISTSKTLDYAILVLSICGNLIFLGVVNISGLKINMLNNKMTAFIDPLNPFMILTGIFAVCVALDIKPFYNRIINYLSGLSLLIYIIHENITVREVYRKYLTEWCMANISSSLMALLMVALIHLIIGTILAIIYKETVSDKTISIANGLFDRFMQWWSKS